MTNFASPALRLGGAERATMNGLTKNAMTVLERRYLKDGETPEDMFFRVATAIAEADREYGQATEMVTAYYDMMTNLEFLPNSPTLMNAGRPLGQLSACFVLPVGDSMEEIFDAVKHAALIHKSGGGTGFAFSRLRPANDRVKTTAGVSSGPVSFMRVFDAATEAIKQGGTRRGANMGILRVDHPDIMDFIMCKAKDGQLSNFNISVGITDAFMAALEDRRDYDLINPRTGEAAGALSAEKVFNRIVAQAWSNGEPGVVFLDTINAANPTPEMGPIEATNPCGEQPLLPYESCNLGSINLGKMALQGVVDWERLRITTRVAIHFLDNVISANRYPLPKIGEVSSTNRKIGLGVMGWADMLIQLGIPYDSDDALSLAKKVMTAIHLEAGRESERLALQRGAYTDGSSRRNATLTTIAPTGTISIIANASSGIEPIFSVAYTRTVMDNDVLIEVHPLFEKMAKEQGFYSKELIEKIVKRGSIRGLDEIPEDIQRLFVTAHDISPEFHVRMQAAFQGMTDNAVSKTVNFPASATKEDVAKVFRMAYELGCKGVTIYRDGSRESQVLQTGQKDKAKAAPIKKNRPKALNGKTYQMITGCGSVYVTINEDETGSMFELFGAMGKAGGCAASQSEAIGRLVSLSWRSGVEAEQVVKQLQGISCHQSVGIGPTRIMSCADAVAKAIQLHMSKEVEKTAIPKGACPECGGIIEHESGCAVCRSCGFSECA